MGPIGADWDVVHWYSNTNWFAYMLNVNWFMDALKSRWGEITATLKTELEQIASYKTHITSAAERNAVLWDFIDDGNIENDFDGYFDKVIEFLNDRIDWIDSQLIN